MSEPTTVDRALAVSVWFDVRCPWCFLGKRRIERAIALFHEQHPDIPVAVTHHSFELAPGIPERFEGGEAEYLLRYEGVPLEQSARTLPALEQLAADEGVLIRFDDLIEVNTRRSHRVFQYGQAAGVGEELLDRLFVGYFSEALDLSRPEVLARLAADVGLDYDDALAAAHSDEHDDTIRHEHARAQMLGGSGVPFSLINAKYAVSGALSDTAFATAFSEIVRREFGDSIASNAE